MGFLTHRKHLYLLLLYPLVGLGFLYCRTTVTSASYLIGWPVVDQAIPFLPFMVWPYVAWYFVVAFPFIWLGIRNGPEFVRYCSFIFGGMTSAYMIYLLFPNGIALRPAFDSLGTGWEYDALRWVYTNSTPRNVCPSIHVIDTIGVWIALSRDKTFNSRWWFKAGLWIICLAIIASTVTIKQHSIIDVFAGILWSGVIYLVSYFKKPSLQGSLSSESRQY